MKEVEVITGLHSMGVSYKRILELFVFNEENPEAWPLMQKTIFAWVNNGAKRISIKEVWECVRRLLSQKEGYKSKNYQMNNNLTSTFSRLAILKYRNLEPFIELRELKQKEAA